MLAGLEWRRENLADAATAYQRGRGHEQSDRYSLSDSCNLTNSFVLRILIDVRQMPVIRLELLEAAAVVRKQIGGERRDQWWAWADYGLLCLLLGDDEQAIRAYRRFEDCGPGPIGLPVDRPGAPLAR